MKSNQSLSLILSSLGFILGACTSSGEQTTTSNPAAPNPSSVATSSVAAAPARPTPPTQAKTTHDSTVSQGGQVIEAGPYHLELVTLKESSGMHLDFYLQKGDTHEAIPDATVKAQIQLPDGTQKMLDFEYDSTGKHYFATLSNTATGKYNVAILTDIKGEKVNGRFNFSQ